MRHLSILIEATTAVYCGGGEIKERKKMPFEEMTAVFRSFFDMDAVRSFTKPCEYVKR